MNKGILGDYISLVNRKNKNLETTKLVGVTIEKQIIDSLCYGKNTNLSICLQVENGEFVVRLFNIEQHKKLAIALYKGIEKVIVSSQYHAFKVTNPVLLSEYLMLMIFKKQITELQLLYMCFGGIRGALAWKDFIRLPIAVPSRETQEKIVWKYQITSKYIDIKKRINELFEKQMLAY